MKIFAFLDHRVRGVRVIDLGAIAVLMVLVLVVYTAKAGAGATRADIDGIEQQISDTQGQIRILRAEVANEEQPERLAALSEQILHLEPIPADHEIPAEALADVARAAEVQPAASSSKPAVVAPAAPAAGAPSQDER